MNVVYVSTLTAGGPLAHMRDLLPRVAQNGTDVTVLCQSALVVREFQQLGLRAYWCPLHSKWDVRGAAKTWRKLGNPDIVHTQDRRSLLLVGAVARLLGAKVVHTYHGLPEEILYYLSPLKRATLPAVSPIRLAWILHGHLRIESWLSHVGTVVVPSRALAEFLVDRGFPASRMRVLPSRIDVHRDEPGPPHDPPRIGTACLLERHKGVDTVLTACSLVTHPMHLDVYGDGTLRADLERQAAKLRIDVTFHGMVSNVRSRLEDLDIFVLASRGENLPISILEAMGAALPVVATRVGGIPELVLDGETGVLVDPDDAVSLARAIDMLLADEDRRVAFGRMASRRIKEKFDAAEAGRQMLQLYEDVCASCT